MQVNPQSEIAEINNRIEDSTSVSGVRFIKKNGIVTVNVYGFKTNGNTTQFVVPNEFRASSSVFAIIYNNSDKEFVYADIVSGNVGIRKLNGSDVPLNKYVYGIITYVQ